MNKEMVVCIIIIIAIVAGYIFTQNNTKRVVATISENLEKINVEIQKNQEEPEKNSINNDEQNTTETSQDGNIIKEKINSLKQQWEKESQKMAYYIEHDELEKVSNAIVCAKANIEVEEYNTATEYIESCKFILQHIQEKESFNLINIF